MKKTIFMVLLSIFLLPVLLFAGENDSASLKRSKWFYNQRYAPDDTISDHLMQSALTERDNIRNAGYFLNPALYQWFSLGGIPGRINFVEYADANTIIFGAPNGGIWRYSNSTWVTMDPNHELKSHTSGAVAIDNSTNPPTVYYGTGENHYGFVYSYLGNGIYKTTNWGENWTHISSGLNKVIQVFRLTIRPNYPSHIFAATNNGLYRSTNGGANWSAVTGTSGLHCNDIAFSKQTDTKAYLTGPNSAHQTIPGVGYRYSTDGGASFTVYTGSDFVPNGRTHIAVSESDEDYVYAVTDIGNIFSYTSTNGGQSFSTGPIRCNTSSQLGYNMLLEIMPDNPGIVFVGGIDLKKSTDYGASYFNINRGYADQHDMDINPENENEWVEVNDGGIYRTTNSGVNWQSIASLPTMNTYRISSGSKIFGGASDRGFVEYNGISFSDSYFASLDGTTVLSSKFNQNVIMGITGASPGGVINISRDGGSSLGDQIVLPGIWDGGNDWIGIITEHPEDAGHFYSSRRNTSRTTIDIYRTTNYGANWDIFGNGMAGTRSPQNLTFSTKDPDVVYFSTSGYDGVTWYEQYFKRAFYRSDNGGEDWEILVPEIDEETIPNLYITRVVTAPAENPNNPDEVYLTFSGFYIQTNLGHVLKSTNEGANWININGNLPNTPVNDIIIWHPTSCNQSEKNITVATDVGVFNSTNGGSNWYELAEDFPLTPVMDLEFVPFFNVIRAATFGMGVWEVGVGKMYITEEFHPAGNIIKSNDDIIICDGGKLVLTNGQQIKLPAGKKIIVEDGGEIELASGSISFTSVSGTWDGIELYDNAVWDISSCSFGNTTTPLKVTGTQEVEFNTLNLNAISCAGFIEINNRSNVNVTNCEFDYFYGYYPAIDVCGVLSSGSNDINIRDNIIKTSATIGGNGIMNSVAIDITYGSNISVQYNTITNISEGILVSNSSPLVKNNTINTTGSLVANVGIGMDYSYSSVLTGNEISNCTTGVSLYSSSPTMFKNVITSSVTGGKGVYANYYSSPKLKPVFAQIGVWDGGLNEITTTGSGAMNINLRINSVPDLDYGCNTLTITTNSGNYFVYGRIDPPSFYTYYIRNNTWLNAFDPGYISLDVEYEESPEGCDIDAPGGGGEMGSNLPVVFVDPPQQVIVNYGNNIYDTLQILNTSRELSQDMALYLSGMNYEITGNFSSAFNTYQQVISNYMDSNTAVYSLKRLLRCKDRLNSDTAAYISLRQYFLNLAGNNQSDTAFVNINEELATKCLVRIGDYSGAITEYENVVNSSNDSLQILGAELNIIETYMLMQQGGDAPVFTGQYAQLKPGKITDGVRMIKQKLYGTSKNFISVVPLKYNISQNYPNPFNPTTKINYELPKNSFVKIVVYDILGREITRLVNNEFKESGRYTVEFNGRNLASGVYFYRIEAGDYVQSKKMILVK